MAKRAIFPALLGNEHLRGILGAAVAQDKPGHAYILEGPPGSGRHTAALAAAAAMSCQGNADVSLPLPCGKCLACRKIAAGVSPDVLFIRRAADRATLGVEAIRDMREDLYIAPNENRRKVYLIEEAELMTPAAQNALLLSLEEPPPYVVFFLLTRDASALLPTIRSRAPILRMQLFDAETLASLLEKKRTSVDPLRFAEAIAASGGALGAAERMLTQSDPDAAEYESLREMASRFVLRMFQPDAADAAAILAGLPKAREDVLAMLRLQTLALRDLVSIKSGAETPLTFYLTREECRPLSERTSIARISLAYRDTAAAYADIQANGSVSGICTALLLKKR